MRASIFLSGAAFAVAAIAQDSSSVDAFPQTSYLLQTNSLGVVTGMPAVVTSQPVQPSQALTQPSVATSVGKAATIPDLGPGLHTYAYGIGTNSTTLIVFSANANGSTSFAPVPTPTPSSQGAGFTGTDGRVTPTATDSAGKLITTASGTAQSTGAAATMRAVAGGVVGVGAFMAAFL
ncbi:hypothetical protein K505DRAFT_298824 [Melanomma pulvis-pyrius CBS 109.77]|uniref:Uncharacterized protein n=1 Tax=Melanomma pulvis-pyrius CBS 109.77 TaxID=1314802 RepID=A0A6A6XKY3_9PLEO|nr:hypothetical protein K505DRAFT_298824 [Melanomma pulvis-pyrius CBS 109.77]